MLHQLLADLQRAGLTDFVSETPQPLTQRREQSPWVVEPVPAAAQTATKAAAPARAIPAPLHKFNQPQPLQVAEPKRPSLDPAAAVNLSGLVEVTTLPQAKAWVVFSDQRLGTPLAGQPVGDLLIKMLHSINLTPAQVNVLRFTEQFEGRRLSASHLTSLGEIITPQLQKAPLPVLIFGQSAAHLLLGRDQPMASIHGQRLDLQSRLTGVATYHPAVLLERPELKKKAWQALCTFQQMGIMCA